MTKKKAWRGLIYIFLQRYTSHSCLEKKGKTIQRKICKKELNNKKYDRKTTKSSAPADQGRDQTMKEHGSQSPKSTDKPGKDVTL